MRSGVATKPSRGKRSRRYHASAQICPEPPFDVLSATNEFLSTLGLDLEDVVGHPVREVFPDLASTQIQEAIGLLQHSRTKVRLRDVECIEPGFLSVDVSLSHKPGSVQLRLIETARTKRSLQKLIASLFQPAAGRSPFFLYMSDVRTRRVRAICNNLTDRFGLGNCFSFAEFQAVSHPEDIQRDAAYLEERLSLPDNECITFDQRMRTVTGEWQLVAARSRVLARGPDGLPSNMMGIVFDASDYHGANLALEKATVALSRAEKIERENLGRNLHDSLSQILVGAKLAAAALDLGDLTAPAVSARVTELDTLIGTALEEIRAFSFLLHPPDLEELGLVETIERLCRGLSWRFGLPIFFEADVIPRQREEVEFALFRVVQEALMNVHRHACANEATVALRLRDQTLELEVRDDGIGMPSDGPDADIVEGVGLSGMRSRISLIGGRLDWKNVNPGLRICAFVGLDPY